MEKKTCIFPKNIIIFILIFLISIISYCSVSASSDFSTETLGDIKFDVPRGWEKSIVNDASVTYYADPFTFLLATTQKGNWEEQGEHIITFIVETMHKSEYGFTHRSRGEFISESGLQFYNLNGSFVRSGITFPYIVYCTEQKGSVYAFFAVARDADVYAPQISQIINSVHLSGDSNSIGMILKQNQSNKVISNIIIFLLFIFAVIIILLLQRKKIKQNELYNRIASHMRSAHKISASSLAYVNGIPSEQLFNALSCMENKKFWETVLIDSTYIVFKNDDIPVCYLTADDDMFFKRDSKGNIYMSQIRNSLSTESTQSSNYKESYELAIFYQNEIQNLDKLIKDGPVNAPLKEITATFSEIIEIIKKKPETVKYMNQIIYYYMPTVVKLLKEYHNLQSKEIQGKNVSDSLKSVEEIIVEVEQIFKQELNRLYTDTATEIDTEVELMRNIMKQKDILNLEMED